MQVMRKGNDQGESPVSIPPCTNPKALEWEFVNCNPIKSLEEVGKNKDNRETTRYEIARKEIAKFDMDYYNKHIQFLKHGTIIFDGHPSLSISHASTY